MSTVSVDLAIGHRIQDLRRGKRMTLEALAASAGVSRAMLSRIERGESSPTAQLLNRICGGLGTTLSQLFASEASAGAPLLRRADQPEWRDPATGYLRRNVSPPGTPVDIVEVAFPAGARVTLDNLHLAETRQHVWVLDGTLELTVGDIAHRLETGDCLAMRLNTPVHFHNPGGGPVRYAVVIHHGATHP
jgi:transcriptional regulator with XRE-family HTH domain